MEVIPAIMPHSRSEMDAYAERFIGLVAAMQIDVMDGVFVPEKTWPYRDSFNAIRIEPLSRASEIAYEIDLMVDRPEDILGYWIQAGAKRVIVHIESTDSFIEILEHFGDVVNIGVAINIGTPVETLFEYLDNESLARNVAFVQCMGIARIGFQGQPFDMNVINTLRGLRKRYPKLIMSVDGGINFETAEHVVRAGANRIVSGSAILGSKDAAHAIERLKSISA
ncbi:MAG: hypothetical protein COZ49_02325 [Candidatus Yonathbacteria bacterium CG_4_10_14_3_um_filter_47_65]|uniref:Ribulose-phosphate 3-epimerase n=2 Tax=Parcubacteria group TaxID=1794811 RepID=A0A2M8D938_9BACT|nr:MAG: hypothetical protein AUJ44_04490 [Candidatus Nomurabacteria bacterium CG1_02_47_685]PIP03905.1 MAG: hypothetical protein COX54_01925 [Candidatus Yonathbacteria bacterium CG23_combo_of_CG06-09_8_20_14_all_46_18]PIQ31187.1 MAG: hypothetical protein COW61_04250 [Candidatus Yonathbacteria bacterium CG17_big_fil_post_rev_8_21_14_2_50_46_19]PIX56403.1 MAG: hypothetical protein COZ49_02325 [Candidatus Yonathbacteria bacterium CG_4_10_14_3_um_filter_47_65]PIY58024.1 MAG: hypothetical protein CO